MTAPEAAEPTAVDLLRTLRQPFPPEQVGLLPKPYSRDSAKGNCGTCGTYHGLPAAHLSYVGHADVTARLLDTDPLWTWEPVALTEHGLPLFDAHGGLWIRLTVLGVTRLGYGDAAGKSGPNAVKEAIGDALRNAAMRFGVALDLWAKGDRDYGIGHDTAEEVQQRPEWYTATLDLIGGLDADDKTRLREWIEAEGYPTAPAEWSEDVARAIRHRAHQMGRR